jgi:hypothetical protein
MMPFFDLELANKAGDVASFNLRRGWRSSSGAACSNAPVSLLSLPAAGQLAKGAPSIRGDISLTAGA